MRFTRCSRISEVRMDGWIGLLPPLFLKLNKTTTTAPPTFKANPLGASFTRRATTTISSAICPPKNV